MISHNIFLQLLASKTFKRRMRVKGIVIARRNRGLGSNFVIRNVIGGCEVERIFPLYSPLVLDVRVLQKAFLHKGQKRVRRAKLYYLRDRPPKQSTVK
jgi:large subunit ribosomal protein L19